MPHIDHDLMERLCAALGDDPLADELRRTARPDSNTDLTVQVPAHLAPSIAHALHVGATRMRMCGLPMESVQEVQSMSRDLDAHIPDIFQALSYDTDTEQLHALARHHTVRVEVEERGWRRYSLVAHADGHAPKRLLLDNEPDRDAAQRLADGLSEHLAGLRCLG